MKKQTLLTITFSVLAITLIAPVVSQAQGSRSSQRVALIDMAHIFKSYNKFVDMRAVLKSEIEQTDQKAKAMANQIVGIQKKLKSGTLKKDSPEYIRNEQQLVELTSKFKGFRENLQREFLRKESKIYKEIYLEVSQMVGFYAKAKGVTLVLRFNRNGVDGPNNGPQDILQKMNRQVVFYQKSLDITDVILKQLNKDYGPPRKVATGKGGTTRQ